MLLLGICHRKKKKKKEKKEKKHLMNGTDINQVRGQTQQPACERVISKLMLYHQRQGYVKNEMGDKYLGEIGVWGGG